MKSIKQTENKTALAGRIVIGLFLVTVLNGSLLSRSQAAQAAVQALAASVKSNEGATKVITSTLEKTPIPIVSELNNIPREVNEVPVLDAATTVTGNPLLKSSNQRQAEVRMKDQQGIEKTSDNDAVSWQVKGIVALLLLLVALRVFLGS